MLDPYNLWVYNATNAATSELPSGAGSSGSYTPEATQNPTGRSLKLEANTTAENSYVSDSVVNEKLKTVEVQLTASGNITVTSKVNIQGSNNNNKLYLSASKGGQDYSGNIKITNATINVAGGATVMGFGNITINRSSLTSSKDVTVATSNLNGLISINNSNLSGATTKVLATQGNVEITAGNLNGTTAVCISASASNGNATLSGVSVNTPDVNVTGSNITLDNATLNVTPSGADKGIKLGTATTKNVVIKNSTLNTTGSTAGVINIQGSTANTTINENGIEPNFSLSFHSQ